MNTGTVSKLEGNAGETSERRGGAIMGFSERIDTILNRTELLRFVSSKDECKTINGDNNLSVYGTCQRETSK